MRRSERNGGFTLIEVSLAIVIGLLVLAGAISIYNQTRVSAGNAAAKEKLLACTMVIEELTERSYARPKLDQLQLAWKAKRPDDFAISPWGGAVPYNNLANDFIVGNDVVPQGVEYGGGPGGTKFGSYTVADRGRIFYFRRDPSGPGRPYIWLDDIVNHDSSDPDSIARVTDYGVAYLGPNGEQFHFIEGKGKTNTAGSPFTTEGQIGN